MFFRKPSIKKQLIKLASRCKSAEDLCRMASELLPSPITILAMPGLPKNVPASAIQYRTERLIIYNPVSFLSISSLSTQLSILHELAHFVLGHLDGVKIDLTEAISGRTYFSDRQERAAEKLACQLLELLTDVHLLSPPNPPMAARYESLIG